MDGQTHGRTDARTDRRTDGQTDESNDGRSADSHLKNIIFPCFRTARDSISSFFPTSLTYQSPLNNPHLANKFSSAPTSASLFSYSFCQNFETSANVLGQRHPLPPCNDPQPCKLPSFRRTSNITTFNFIQEEKFPTAGVRFLSRWAAFPRPEQPFLFFLGDERSGASFSQSFKTDKESTSAIEN